MIAMFAGYLVVLLAISPQHSNACTTFAAGKKATADGSVIVSHSNDGDPVVDTRYMYVPSADHKGGSNRAVYDLNPSEGAFPRFVGNDFGPDYYANTETGPVAPGVQLLGYIPQVAHTFGYQDSFFGVTNENNVAMGESTCSAMFKTCAKGSKTGCEDGRSVGVAMMSIDTLTKIAMERSSTAREAVQLMGDLAVKYGFYGTQDDNGAGEALQVGDADEAFTFNILADPTGTSAIWAAQRVPDENVTVLSNMFTIREVDVNDSFNFLASENIFSIALGLGWLKPGQPLDFTRVYSNGEYGNKYYAGHRMWAGLNRLAPSLNLIAVYDDIRYDRMWPWSVKPDKLITARDVMSFHRDWFAGTPLDMTKQAAAGPFGTPDRYATSSKNVIGDWPRSIAIYRTNWLHVQQLRKPSATLPKALAGVTWFGSGAAHYAAFIPIPSGLTRSLTTLKTNLPGKFSRQSMNWASRKIGNICQIRFDKMHPLVEERQNDLEAKGAELVEAAAAEVVASGSTGKLNDMFDEFASKVLGEWNDLADELLFRFSDNTDTLKHIASKGEEGSLGYPDAWLRSVGYQKGPPVPPVEKQCPPTCPPEGNIVV